MPRHVINALNYLMNTIEKYSVREAEARRDGNSLKAEAARQLTQDARHEVLALFNVLTVRNGDGQNETKE